MGTDALIPAGTNIRPYEAVLRISEMLSACREFEELTRILADKLVELMAFDHLDVLVFKQNSKEIE